MRAQITNPSDRQALEEPRGRRAASVPFDGAEFRARIQALGDVALNDSGRHDAFREVYDALTLSPFQLMPFPDDSTLDTATNGLRLQAVLVDAETEGQVAAEIHRSFQLDSKFVEHKLLLIQKPYRRAGLSHVLLSQAFPFYRRIGLDFVLVHAALQSGRWHWARMGFTPVNQQEQDLHDAWSLLCLHALGLPLLAPGTPISVLKPRAEDNGTGTTKRASAIWLSRTAWPSTKACPSGRRSCLPAAIGTASSI
jgi:GNAT superfamily N-acetyltransferase